ncbi:MAG: cytochrome P460 family protein, partial [Tagaea sp.]|nr:cytochrome P460 family protein [Tagaea sp.]
FVIYNEIERPDRNPLQIRLMYANPEAIAAARQGQPVPRGTILVMEDRAAELGADGQPVLDSRGRMKASSRILNVFVMEKREGWGAEYPPERRNGEWEYATYTPEVVKRPGVNTQGCFQCHTARRGQGRDYTFTFMQWVDDGKPGPR